MGQSGYVTWIIERSVAKGEVRIGIAGGRLVAELAGKRVELPNGDILSLAEVAANRWMQALVAPLRDGGYAHLLGGKIGLLPGEAQTLKAVAMGTPEGLAIRRAALVDALTKERAAASADPTMQTGLIHHTDGLESEVSPTRRALEAFDRAHPKLLAAIKAMRDSAP